MTKLRGTLAGTDIAVLIRAARRLVAADDAWRAATRGMSPQAKQRMARALQNILAAAADAGAKIIWATERKR